MQSWNETTHLIGKKIVRSTLFTDNNDITSSDIDLRNYRKEISKKVDFLVSSANTFELNFKCDK